MQCRGATLPSGFQYMSFFIGEKKKVAVICDVGRKRLTNCKACIGQGGYYREVDLRESRCHALLMFQVGCRFSKVRVLAGGNILLLLLL